MNSATKITHTSDTEYSITRLVDAPIKKVWSMWTEAEHLRHWFCPKNFKVTKLAVEPVKGGGWMIEMQGADGGVYTTSGTFLNVVKQQRLEMTQTWKNSEHQSIISVLFNEDGAKTEINFKQAYLESKVARESHAAGWNEALTNLKAYLQP